MDYENPLDHLIHRFQHRWETNPQFRAAMSGVLGLSLIIFLCVGVAGVNAAATRVLGAVGFGSSGGGQGNIDPGGQIVNGNWTFYTPTVPDWKGGSTPGSSPINNSQTPQPSPTPTATPPDAPTATPCRGSCGGGGGQTGNVSASWNPTTWTSGMHPTFTVHTTNATTGQPQANVKVAIIYTWAGGATFLDEKPSNQTDSNGNYVSYPTVGGCVPSKQFDVYVMTFWGGTKKDSHFFVTCA
jgi:hypothetical protein